MKTLLPEVKTFAVRHTVADTLRDALLEGHFTPGESLSEVELAAQLKVSRVPIREALLVLSQEGLVTHSQNRGFSVIELSPRERRETEQVRIPLESMALTLARERVSGDDLQRLEDLKNDLLEKFQKREFANCVREDIRFHRALWEMSGNTQLANALDRLMTPYFIYNMLLELKTSEVSHESLTETHDLYLNYLRGNCAQSAEECVRLHIGRRRDAFTPHENGNP